MASAVWREWESNAISVSPSRIHCSVFAVCNFIPLESSIRINGAGWLINKVCSTTSLWERLSLNSRCSCLSGATISDSGSYRDKTQDPRIRVWFQSMKNWYIMFPTLHLYAAHELNVVWQSTHITCTHSGSICLHFRGENEVEILSWLLTELPVWYLSEWQIRCLYLLTFSVKIPIIHQHDTQDGSRCGKRTQRQRFTFYPTTSCTMLGLRLLAADFIQMQSDVYTCVCVRSTCVYLAPLISYQYTYLTWIHTDTSIVMEKC